MLLNIWLPRATTVLLTQLSLAIVAPGPASGKVAPKIAPFQFRKTFKPGENARTTCLVEAGDAPMTFSWLRNGADASVVKNVNIQSNTDFSVLTVNPADASSAGNFTCIVKNRAGFDSFTALLDVEGEYLFRISRNFQSQQNRKQ